MRILAGIIANADFISILVRPGPGDALRFCFAFANYIKINKPGNPVLIITSFVEKNVMPLLYTSPCVGMLIQKEDWASFTYMKTDSGLSIIRIDIEDIDVVLAYTENSTHYHAFELPFADYSSSKYNAAAKRFPKTKFELLDRAEDKKYMAGQFSERFAIAHEISARSSKRVIVFLRQEPIVPQRNTPIELFRKLVYFLLRHRYEVFFSGSPLVTSLLLSEAETNYVITHHLFPDGVYPSYYEQMTLYQMQFRFAIGVNSGGLDLALAAGVPGIRVGAFHHLQPHHGPLYNHFLATAQVIDIPSASEHDLSNITLLKSIKAVCTL